MTDLTVNGHVLYLLNNIALYIIIALYMPSWAQGPREQTTYSLCIIIQYMYYKTDQVCVLLRVDIVSVVLK